MPSDTIPAGMLTKDQIPDSFPQKKTGPVDRLTTAILTKVKAAPGSTRADIARHCVQIGAAKHLPTVYNKLRKSEYLRAEIQKIRDANRQYLDRLVVPDALKVMHKAIKSKELSDDERKLLKAKEMYVKLAVDKSFGEIRHSETPSAVNIANIERLQVAIAADLGDKLADSTENGDTAEVQVLDNTGND
jgi:hypothetical protein